MRLSVAISVSMSPGVSGGIEQSTVGLIRSLGTLEGPERYRLIVKSDAHGEWLKSYCGPNQELVVRTESATARAGFIKRSLRPAARYVQNLLSVTRHWPEVPVSDGFYESLGCDVIHFPTQVYTFCAVPTIYNPHDLLHLRYPQFFSTDELIHRETVYPAACRYANTVVVGTQWVKDDVIRRYGTDPEKVQVIPWASPTEFYANPSAGDVAEIPAKYQLRSPFALYPAQTWPHKNHLRLLDALAYLRDERGLKLQLVCTGSRYKPFWPQVEAQVRTHRLEDQVKFLGFIPDADLRGLYRLAQFLVLPTLYEADSCPVHEAWAEGLPVASSNVTAMPDQVNDAGLLFNPFEVRAIADAMARLSSDEGLRIDLREKGYRRVRDFDWNRTAKAFRAVYRRAADIALNEEDQALLRWDWMRQPLRSAVS